MKLIDWDVFKYGVKASGFNSVIVIEAKPDEGGAHLFAQSFTCDAHALTREEVETMMRSSSLTWNIWRPTPAYLMLEYQMANTSWTAK